MLNCQGALRTGQTRPLLQRGVAALRLPGLSHVLPHVPELHRGEHLPGAQPQRRAATNPLLIPPHTRS